MEYLVEVFTLILKIFVSFYLSGIVFTTIIWPHNEQPTTKNQWVLGVVVVIILNYFMWG